MYYVVRIKRRMKKKTLTHTVISGIKTRGWQIDRFSTCIHYKETRTHGLYKTQVECCAHCNRLSRERVHHYYYYYYILKVIVRVFALLLPPGNGTYASIQYTTVVYARTYYYYYYYCYYYYYYYIPNCIPTAVVHDAIINEACNSESPHNGLR